MSPREVSDLAQFFKKLDEFFQRILELKEWVKEKRDEKQGMGNIDEVYILNEIYERMHHLVKEGE